MSILSITLILGIVAALANIFGGLIVTARPWSRAFLAYFIALGSGFMLATATLEMIPKSFQLAPKTAPMLILLGYFIVHFFEHSWPAHFHFGEETHHDAFLDASVVYPAVVGLLVHTFFEGVAIASGFLVSDWLGWMVFGTAIVHNIPEGFTVASIMVAARKNWKAGIWAAAALGGSRILGILVMGYIHQFVEYGLALAAGVTLYVAASDLIPEVNKMAGMKIPITVGLGVSIVLMLRILFT